MVLSLLTNMDVPGSVGTPGHTPRAPPGSWRPQHPLQLVQQLILLGNSRAPVLGKLERVVSPLSIVPGEQDARLR